jgi:hypothetical protein|tara:strand:+ start:828 stop:959 length:132 start_codon:yes stop_codon:yes gene_type:complete
MKTNYFWLPFGSLLPGIIGIIGPGGNPGITKGKNKPVFFPIFP